VFVALGIQHAMCMRRTLLSSVSCLGLPYFYPSSHKGQGFREKNNIKICVFGFSTTIAETFLILRRIQRDITSNARRSAREVPVTLFRFHWPFNLIERISKNSQIDMFTKIRPMGAQLFRTDGQANM
jgi:hypothetical protein